MYQTAPQSALRILSGVPAFLTPPGAFPQIVDDVQEGKTAHDADSEQNQRVVEPSIKEIAHGKQGGPNHRAPRHPSEQSHRNVLPRSLRLALGYPGRLP